MKNRSAGFLIINDEPLVLKEEFVQRLNAARKVAGQSARHPPFPASPPRAKRSPRSRRTAISRSSWSTTSLYTLNQKSPKKEMSALELVQRVTRFRPELDVYILIAQEHEDEIVDCALRGGGRRLLLQRGARTTAACTGYSTRRSRSVRARRSTTSSRTTSGWRRTPGHTPGHSSGESPARQPLGQ